MRARQRRESGVQPAGQIRQIRSASSPSAGAREKSGHGEPAAGRRLDGAAEQPVAAHAHLRVAVEYAGHFWRVGAAGPAPRTAPRACLQSRAPRRLAHSSAGRSDTYAPSNGASRGSEKAASVHHSALSFMRAIYASTSGAPEGLKRRFAHLPLCATTTKSCSPTMRPPASSVQL